MEIEFFQLSLHPIKQVNRFQKMIRETLLLRIDGKYFLNYHPWPEFGDLTVSEFLNVLKKTRKLPLFLERQLELEMDCNKIPKLDFLNHSFEKEVSGLPITKIKYFGDLEFLGRRIKDSRTLLRIDFNFGLTELEFKEFVEGLNSVDFYKIDYFEDPCHFSNNSEYFDFSKIKVASDRIQFQKEIHTCNIYKPNIDDSLFIKDSIISSYMGHDLGIYHTYLFLMKYGDLTKYHGVVTPGIYKESTALFNFKNNKFSINSMMIEELYKSLGELEWKRL